MASSPAGFDEVKQTPSTTTRYVGGDGNTARSELEDLKARLQSLEDEVNARRSGTPSSKQDGRCSSLAPTRSKLRFGMVVLVVVNFLLWISMIYSVFRARDYHYNQSRYFAVTWIIFFAPLIVGVLVWSAASLSHRRLPWTNAKLPRARTLTILNGLNAIACFAFVTVYVYYSAIPQFNTPKWQSNIDFLTALPLPAFALLVPTARGSRLHDPIPLLVPSSTNGSLANALTLTNGSSSPFPSSATSIQALDSDHWTAVVFNASLLNDPSFSTIQDRLYFSMDLSYNSSDIHQDGSTDDLDDGAAVVLNFEMFDPRLSLQSVFDCEIAHYPVLAAFAHNTLSINVEYLTDEYGLVISPDPHKSCGREYHELLASEYPSRYATYTWQLESSIPVASNLTESCDVAFNPDNRCTTSVSISFGSHLVRSMKSMPGLSHLEIWLNAGAIAGAVQFFAWFLEILLVV